MTFQDSLINIKFKWTAFICNIINIFVQFNSPLLDKSINFFKQMNKLHTPKFWTIVYKMCKFLA